MKAQESWDRGHERKDPFDAFGDYWRAFNNLYAGQRGHETQKIRSFLAEQVSEDQAQSVLNAHGKGIACLLDRPINNMRGNGRDTAANIAAFHKSANEKIKLQEE